MGTDFYSHAREGRDMKRTRKNNIDYMISTHTPARGVTRTVKPNERNSFYFYSHAREGRDDYLGVHPPASATFLLTRPRGA